MGQVYGSEPNDPNDQKWSPDLNSPDDSAPDRPAHGAPAEPEQVEVVRRRGGQPAVAAESVADRFNLGGALSPAGARGGCAARFGLLLVCLLAFVPGFFALPVIDRDEARFAQASRQMFESVALPAALRDPARHGGGWLVPKVQDRERLNKPPLIYWLQATSTAVLTAGRPHADQIWMYRVPSLIAAIAVVLITWRLGWLLFDARTGAVAGALIAVSPVIAWEAHQARADMVLLAWTMLAQFMLWRIFASRHVKPAAAASPEGEPSEAHLAPGSFSWAIWFWVAIAAGIMTKGPITPMVAAFTAVGLSAAFGHWRWLLQLRPLIGILIVALAVLPWVWGVAQQVGWDTYLSTIHAEVLGRSMAPKEGHWGPPGYHILLLPVLFWPGSLLTAAALGLAFRATFGQGGSDGSMAQRLRARLGNVRTSEPSYIFLLAWIVPAWIIFELVSTKLPHYTMPLYPALAILSAHALFAAEAGLLPKLRKRMGRLGLTIWLLIGGALIGVAFTGLALVVLQSGPLGTIFFIFVGLAFAGVTFINLKQAAKSWGLARYARAQLAGVLVGLAILIVVIGIAAPRLITLSSALVGAIEAVDPSGIRPVALVRYHEDSMIFLTRGRAQRIGPETLERWFAENPTGLAVVPQRMHEDLPWAQQVSPPLSGFNYAKGRIEHLMVIERTSP